MDVVYLVRPGEANEELRHSLRSLKNLPHDTVWIAGYRPTWCTANHIPTDQADTKHVNALRNLRAALGHPGVSQRFILFNDDFFVTQPLDKPPVLHTGRVIDVLTRYKTRHPRGSSYITAMEATFEYLVNLGFRYPLSYDNHTPMVFDKTLLARVLDDAMKAGMDVPRFHYRTAYGNLMGVGGTQYRDAKVYDTHTAQVNTPYTSTHDRSFGRGRIGVRLRAMFPDPSPYEV